MRFALPLAVSFLAQVALAQTPGRSATLTLDEAIILSRRNNPLFQQTINNRRSADASVRSAYAGLLPRVDANFRGAYQEGGQQIFSGLTFQNSDTRQSSYGLNLNYQLSSATIFQPRVAGANRAAAEADVTGAAELLRATVTQQYITVLQAQARAALADTLGQTTKAQLELAEARQSVGAGIILDVRRAQVAAGQSEVSSLQAHNTAEVEMLRLFQQLGIAQPANVVLTTRFDIVPVNFKLDSLLRLAQTTNPGLNALRSRENAAHVEVKAVAGQYAPTLSMSTGWGGNSFQYVQKDFYVQQGQRQLQSAIQGCQQQNAFRAELGAPPKDCSALPSTMSDAEVQAALAQNDVFPFKFTKNPRSFSAVLSIPIFDNLNREERFQFAQVQRDNARYNVRASELRLTADVTQAYLNLQTAIRTVALQEVNASRAREELAFAEERYKAGSGTFLDVTTSRGTFEQAQIDRVNAIYDYHRAFAALESAVGRPLR